MRDGSMVVIDFVRDQGFSPCPYCWNDPGRKALTAKIASKANFGGDLF